MSRPSSAPLPAFAILILLLGAPAAAAELGCGLESRAGASLLLPYFEVELGNPSGRTTSFSVGNSSDVTVLAHVVVWTSWGHAAASFDVGIEPRALRTFNMRDVLVGRLPETQPPAVDEKGRYASCVSPVVLPVIEPARLEAFLAGRPSPDDGLCYAAPTEGRLATGYVTVDVVNDCSGAALVAPGDAGYFGDCASGLAANENALWGDFFLVDPGEDFAQGERLVVLSADQTRFGSDICVDPPCGDRNPNSFYDPQSNRMPLPSAYETRFLHGGGFDGGTELLVWVQGQMGPTDCSAGAAPASAAPMRLTARTERGADLGSTLLAAGSTSFRLPVGGEDLPLPESFGCLDVRADGDGWDRQIWVMPLLSATGRYSVGLGALPVADFCY